MPRSDWQSSARGTGGRTSSGTRWPPPPSTCGGSATSTRSAPVHGARPLLDDRGDGLLRRGPRRPDRAGRGHRHPGRLPLPAGDGGAGRRQARARREAADRVASPTGGSSSRRPRTAAWSSCATTRTATPPPCRSCGAWCTAASSGDVQFVDSVRINLGLVQPDVDVLWDLAPHDLSILDFLLPAGVSVVAVAAHGADPIGHGMACVGYLTLRLSTGAIAHVHVNWLSPIKIRTMVIGGSQRTVVWDDMNPSQRLAGLRPRGGPRGRAGARPRRPQADADLLPDRRHGGAGPARAGGAARDDGGVRGVHPRGPAARDRRRRRAAGHGDPRGGRSAACELDGTFVTLEGPAMIAGQRLPGDRWGRHHRLDHRRPARRRRRGRDRGARQLRARPQGEPRRGPGVGPGRGHRGRHPRRRRRARGHRRGRRRLPPGGHPDHAVRRGAPAGARGARGRHVQRPRGGRRRRRPQGGRRVVGLGLRPGDRVPHDRDPAPLGQRHLLRRRQGLQRGDAPQLPRHVRAGLRGPAVLQRLRPADGRPRPLHRGAHPVDGAHRGRDSRRSSSATASRRWTSSTPPTSPGPTCSPPSRPSTDEVFNIGSGTETSLLGAGRGTARASWAATCRSSSARSARSTA